MTSPAPDIEDAPFAAAHAHVEACEAVNDEYEETGDLEVLATSPAVDPYDGCTTCQVREAVSAARPVILAGAAELIAEHLPVMTDAGASAAMKLLRAEAARVALPHTPHGEGVHA